MLLKAVFAVFFSRICSLTDKWDEAILDPELNEEFKTFLKVLQEKLPLMTSMPRCVVPPGFFPAGLNGHSDGSLFLSSWIFFILSHHEDDPTKFSSWITGAGAKVKHHSVVGNEMMSIYLLMENVTGYVFNHHSSLFSSPPQDFPIRLGMDSECVLYSLNPLKINKSVLVKNAVRAIHSFCQDLTTKWPHVSIIS